MRIFFKKMNRQKTTTSLKWRKRMTSLTKFFIVALAFLLIIVGAFYAGKKAHDPKIKWYSDMTSQLQGHKIYLIDTPVTCPNRTVQPDPKLGPRMIPGKEIVKLQIDVNLQNGDLKV